MDRIGKFIEKKLEFNHHEKVGVVNALVGASTMLTNAPRLLNLEHNHYINNSGCKDLYDTTKHKRSPKSNRKATCCQLSLDDSTLAKVCRIWTKNGKVICCQLSSYGKSLITVKHGLDLSLLVCLSRQLINLRLGLVEIYSESSLLGVGSKLCNDRMGVVAIFSCE